MDPMSIFVVSTYLPPFKINLKAIVAIFLLILLLTGIKFVPYILGTYLEFDL